MDAPTFTILAEPTRLRILEELRHSDCYVGDLTGRLNTTQPTISKHLKILRDAGFVECRADAQRRIYRLKTQPLEDIDGWLQPYRRLWTRHLDALEQYLNEQEDSR